MLMQCPICKRPADASKNNRYRPFCSERCRDIDLGTWVGENYRIPGNPIVEDANVHPDDDLPVPNAPQRKIIH
jgi:endogenous inhibitor of DNA gyrase (YacG/DUF329 family)